jgi:endoglucanase
VADHLVVDLGGRTLLLPGIDGFAHETWLVVNPSYWIFPAFDAFAEAFGNPQWRALTQSGYTLLREARFGDWHLPSDWLRVDADSVTPAPGFPPRFSYDAVRIPLNLAWAAGAPAELSQPFQGFWAAPHGNQTPAWVDIDDGSVAPYAWPTGMQSIAWLAGAGADHHRTGPPPLPRDDEGYYSWGLSLLCRVAAADRSP